MHNAIWQVYNAGILLSCFCLVTYLYLASSLSRLKYGFDSR